MKRQPPNAQWMRARRIEREILESCADGGVRHRQLGLETKDGIEAGRSYGAIVLVCKVDSNRGHEHITQSVLDVRPMLHRLPEQGIEQLLLLSFGRAVHALPVIRYTEGRPMPSCLAMKEATPNSGEGCPLALR